MHRNVRKLGTPPWANHLLAKARVARLATSTRNGTPTVVPICFVYNQGRLYSAIDEKPKKTKPINLRRIRNIIENPQVSLVADEYREDWKRLRYVIVMGHATILMRGKEHREAISLLRKKYRQYAAMQLEQRPIIRVKTFRSITWKSA